MLSLARLNSLGQIVQESCTPPDPAQRRGPAIACIRAPVAERTRWRQWTNANNEGSLAGLKVMVIDDSKTIRRTAETLLKKEGCDVVTATDGFEALAKISDQQPQIIFVDIMMPRLDGYQTCALIKNNRCSVRRR